MTALKIQVSCFAILTTDVYPIGVYFRGSQLGQQLSSTSQRTTCLFELRQLAASQLYNFF